MFYKSPSCVDLKHASLSQNRCVVNLLFQNIRYSISPQKILLILTVPNRCRSK